MIFTNNKTIFLHIVLRCGVARFVGSVWLSFDFNASIPPLTVGTKGYVTKIPEFLFTISDILDTYPVYLNSSFVNYTILENSLQYLSQLTTKKPPCYALFLRACENKSRNSIASMDNYPLFCLNKQRDSRSLRDFLQVLLRFSPAFAIMWIR